MKISTKTYIICLSVGFLSFLVAYTLPTEKLLTGLISTPGVIAFLGILWQIYRENIQHEMQKEIQNREHNFHLTIFSHMANVAFDKHVEFSEKYILKFQEIITKIIVEETDEPFKYVRELANIRFEYTTWLTSEMTKDIIDIEEMINEMFAKERHADRASNGQKRNTLLEDASKIFQELIKGNEKDKKGSAIARLTDILQNILGIKELTVLRKNILKKAIKAIN